MQTREQGLLAERLALRFLSKQGLKLIDQNYHCRGGEIDLIMQDGDTLVFVEVRYRKSNAFGSAVETVNYTKQQRIIHTAQHYIQAKQKYSFNCRFDIVGINDNNQIEWLKDAFQVN
jgi:putative endonuclease